MEGYHHSPHAHYNPHGRTSHLTKLYSDAKKSALTSIEVQPEANTEIASLFRKYRIQKDRLITWGIEWTDGEKGPDGNIDESVARAGLTETVDSVLRNIKEVADEAERIKVGSLQGGLTGKDGKFAAMSPVFDEARYEDLLRDLTTSIDILYDLSNSRRALARGEHPRFEEPLRFDDPLRFPDDKPSGSKAAMARQEQYDAQAFAQHDPAVYGTDFTQTQLSAYSGIGTRIDRGALQLPEEGPPPYEAVGVPSTTRMVAQLIRAKVSISLQDALGSNEPVVPVLVEFANFDPIYQQTGVTPPLQRLEAIATLLRPMREESQFNLSLLGYFEDPYEPRIGLVYDLPYVIQNKLLNAGQTLAPMSLLKIVQKTTKTQAPGSDVAVPALEDRFRLALRLTEQLYALHSQQVAHGNINSSSIVFTTTANETLAGRKEQLRAPLWASFDLFSKSNIEGANRTTNLNIYRHPLDSNPSANRAFAADVKFDLYGLGTILLEIGLWTPLSELYKAKYSLADFKLRLEKLWIPKLAAKCGSAYMQAVETCLRISDDQDNSRITVEGVYGILLQYLKRCCLLDDIGTSLELIEPSEFTFDTMPSFNPARRSMPAREDTQVSMRSAATFDSDAPTRMNTLSRQETGLQQASPPLAKPSRQFHFSSAPSSREFKRRITLIQRRWRECRTARAEEYSKAATRARAGRTRSGLDALAEKRARPKREEYPWMSLPTDVLEHWQTTLCFQLSMLVEKALKGSLESSSIRLVQYGESPETARPTLVIGCTSTAKVKHALKRHFHFDHNAYDIRVKKENVRRCRRSRRDRRPDSPHRSMAGLRDPNVEVASNPDYQEQPVCGASIGAYRDDEHLPPVSFGGVILVDGKPYGMSVHHMLEPDDDDDVENSEQAAAAADDDEDDDDDSDTSSLGSDDDDDTSEFTDQSTVRPPSAHSSDEMSSLPDDSFGDCPGIVPGDIEEIAITQPALDDALDLDLHAEEDEDDADSVIDEDHLLSYKLGQVYASSGLKRTQRSHEGGFKSISQSLPQEIDWALFELLPPRIHPYNIIKGGTRFCSTGPRRGKDSLPTAVRRSDELACAKVHCLGRTSGLGSGVVSSAMELVKIHGRSTFSASWTVAGDFGIGGDSGAWVISNDDSRVCGHVLASRKGRTYICPMDLLLEDIRVTLGATKVELPTAAMTQGPKWGVAAAMPQAVADTFGRMKIAVAAGETEMGGVALPPSPMKMGRGRESARVIA